MDDKILKIVKSINSLLDKQLGYYEKILKLGQEEKEAIDTQNTRSLMKVLSWKQKYLNKIEGIKAELLNCKEQWQPVKDSVDDSIKKEIKERTDKTEEVLKAIIDLEKENIDMAEQYKNKSSKKISDFKYNTNAVKSYLGSGKNKPRNLMDKKT